MTEPASFAKLRIWAKENGGFIHPALRFVHTADGSKVVTADNIPPHSPVLSCPFSLAITPETASAALKTWLQRTAKAEDSFIWEQSTQSWTERMFICSYIVTHWLARDSGLLESAPELRHFPYLETLPPLQLLSTSLTFSNAEMELLKGTNLYGATIDRRNELLEQCQQCQSVFKRYVPDLADSFTFERYQTAAIYISSRSFPSILLSPNPSLAPTASSPSHPVLLPLLDSLNHERSTPVTWMVDRMSIAGSPVTQPASSVSPGELAVSIVVGSEIKAGSEVLNNYGPKPNSELVLGYGFALPINPDDTIILQLGGSPKKWEIAREGRPGTAEALDGIFREAFDRLLIAWKVDMKEELGPEWDGNHDDVEFEVDMLYMRKDAALMLLEASRSRLEGVLGAKKRLDALSAEPSPPSSVRAEVLPMLGYYVEGEVAISRDVIEYLKARLDSAKAELHDLGVEDAEGSEEDV
ncbi:hypothetical protein FS837_009533 [Tulasnella sp. UAMH 9824]|nr:hypothetical protein FS837_009533 [Tulasnella sp. UAMH 9824]